MNMQELSAFVETSLNSNKTELLEFKTHHFTKLKERGLLLDDEGYKFTNLMRFFEDFPKSETGATDTTLDHLSGLPTFLFVDGKLESKPEIPGVSVHALYEKFSDVSKMLSKNSPLSDLHHSLLNEGLIIEVAKDTKVHAPIRVLHIIRKKNILAPSLILKVGRFAEVALVEETRGPARTYAQISEGHIHVDTGAKVEHVQLDRGQSESLHHASTWVHVEQDASYSNFIFQTSGKLNRRNLDLRLARSGANGETYNLFLVEGTEHSDINTVINHEAPDTTSNQIAKGILGGDSKGIFTGKIHIRPKAQRVVSGQLNKNLLLSKKAQIHSLPQLEIFADDVKCSHGSTTGQLSDEEIFYFESRGLPADKARTLLAHGFALEIVQKIKNIEVKKRLSQLVLHELQNKFQLGGNL